MIVKNNSLYVCETYHLSIYETKEHAKFSANATYRDAAYWSKELNSTVMVAKPGELIFLLKEEDDCWQVIISEKIGWIRFAKWLGISRVN